MAKRLPIQAIKPPHARLPALDTYRSHPLVARRFYYSLPTPLLRLLVNVVRTMLLMLNYCRWITT